MCEYIGEVLNDEEANRRGERFYPAFAFVLVRRSVLLFVKKLFKFTKIFRYDQDGCSYLYDIDAHIDGARGLSEGTVPYVIDATKYGNVSRFINHR